MRAFPPRRHLISVPFPRASLWPQSLPLLEMVAEHVKLLPDPDRGVATLPARGAASPWRRLPQLLSRHHRLGCHPCQRWLRPHKSRSVPGRSNVGIAWPVHLGSVGVSSLFMCACESTDGSPRSRDHCRACKLGRGEGVFAFSVWVSVCTD
jgi:hypothetical protein